MFNKIAILLACFFLFASSASANVVDSNGKEVNLLKTTDGYLAVDESVQSYIENLKRHTVIVMLQKDGLAYRGAGIAVDKRHILTVNHVAALTSGSNNYYFSEKDGEPYDATVIKNDPSHDLALLEISQMAPDLPEPLTFASSIDLDDTVFTIGHPENGLYSLTVGRVWRLSEKAFNDIDSVRLNIKIKGGNSGGFAINEQGQIVGMIFSGGQVINMGYMINLNDIETFLNKVETP